ncbi:MAG: DGQHR domain-containing protein [Candidatus Binatia bacterium]|jgi:DNA sulfur modification protein DndB
MTPATAAKGPLVLPAIRAKMGSWVYYITFVTMREIADRVSIGKEMLRADALKELLQRQLTKRSSEIAIYLCSQRQRFFNALVVGTQGGRPQWNELAIRADNRLPDVPKYLEGALGVLTLQGTENFFAIDGQHRIAGIREAITKKEKLGSEEVCVLFVPGVTAGRRSQDPEGFERTRRLFTTLNRYAKPVGKRDIIALDEDDVVAIITRRLVEEYPLLVEKVSVKQNRSIDRRDKRSLTTIIVLYDVVDTHLRSTPAQWKVFKRLRPPDETIEALYQRCTKFLGALESTFPPLRELKASRADEQIAGRYRHPGGGHLLFRPIGLLLIVRAIRHLTDSGLSLKEALRRVSRVPMDLDSAPWAGLLWDNANRRIVSAPENQKVALRMLFFGLGGDLSKFNMNSDDLRRELAGLLQRDVSTVELPRFVGG